MAPTTATTPRRLFGSILLRGGTVLAIATGLTLSACGGVSLPFGKRENAGQTANAAQSIGVNGFLWRASLDTLGFMPLASADPYGGVINYDWYSDPQTPNERFKATVLILDRRLRADALDVRVTKEVKGADGGWAPTEVAAQTEIDLENAILTKARQLNLSYTD